MGSIVDVARDTGSFSTLLTALEAAGLDATLSDEDSDFTVFAPTDEAFEVLGGTLDTLLADTDLLTDVLLYHVITDSVVGSNTVSHSRELHNSWPTRLSWRSPFAAMRCT